MDFIPGLCISYINVHSQVKIFTMFFSYCFQPPQFPPHCFPGSPIQSIYSCQIHSEVINTYSNVFVGLWLFCFSNRNHSSVCQLRSLNGFWWLVLMCSFTSRFFKQYLLPRVEFFYQFIYNADASGLLFSNEMIVKSRLCILLHRWYWSDCTQAKCQFLLPIG